MKKLLAFPALAGVAAVAVVFAVGALVTAAIRARRRAVSADDSPPINVDDFCAGEPWRAYRGPVVDA